MDHCDFEEDNYLGNKVFFPSWYEHRGSDQDFHRVVMGLHWGTANTNSFKTRPFYSRGILKPGWDLG